MRRSIVGLAVSLLLLSAALSQEGPRPGRRAALPEPTRANLRYGPHERNVLDLWKADAEAPTPLVIYYHGGGFRAGDKRSLDPSLLAGLLARGISVAAANYRLTDAAPFPAPMLDSARALQFLRSRARELGLDPGRVAATGGSAGAGISLWLAFHDDLADPSSDDPVARESTRISAAVVHSAQSSYDPRFIRKLFHTTRVESALLPLFGMRGSADVDDPRFFPLFEEASPLTHATRDDPPVYLFYPQANEPLPEDSPGGRYIHHPRFGLVLKERLAELGVECVVRLREELTRGTPPVGEHLDFLLAKLGGPVELRRAKAIEENTRALCAPVTLRADGAPLPEVLEQLGRLAGVRIVVPEDLRPRVASCRVYFDSREMPLGDMLRFASRLVRLEGEWTPTANGIELRAGAPR